MPAATPQTDEQIEARMRTIRDLHAWGIFLVRQRLKRENPGLSKAQLGRKLEEYLIHADRLHETPTMAPVPPSSAKR